MTILIEAPVDLVFAGRKIEEKRIVEAKAVMRLSARGEIRSAIDKPVRLD
jgi:hypothetical protein